jgi:Spy/CpxP family protein refolding chaperone
MRIARVLLGLAVALLIASPLLAADDTPAKPKREGRARGGAFGAEFLKVVETLDLTDKQKEDLKALKEEAAELTKKSDGILTADQKAARKTAMDDAKAANKDGRAIFQAGQAAVTLDEGQKKAQADVREQWGKFREKVMNLLTDEQKKALREKMPRRGGGEKKDK